VKVLGSIPIAALKAAEVLCRIDVDNRLNSNPCDPFTYYMFPLCIQPLVTKGVVGVDRLARRRAAEGFGDLLDCRQQREDDSSQTSVICRGEQSDRFASSVVSASTVQPDVDRDQI
jgi:hypothetical protein